MSELSPVTLLKEKVITADQLATAQYHQKKRGISLQESLIELNLIDPSILSTQPTNTTSLRNAVDFSLAQLLPHAIKEKFLAVPLFKENDTLFIGTTHIHNVILKDTLAKHLPNHSIEVIYLPVEEIKRIISFQENTSVENLLYNLNNNVTPEAATHFIDFMIIQGIKNEASDLHFHPSKTITRVLYRIDGILHQKYSFHIDHWPKIISRLKVISGLNLAESRQPQSGKFSFQLGHRLIDCRISTHPTLQGESAVIRILDQQKALKKLQDLGLSETGLITVKRILKKPYGLVVMTGPTGSGKTTTLYAMLQHFESHNLNIMTLEDPVEYQLPHIRQSQVQPAINFTYAEGIKSLMRQDPDIILVGEIRDEETAQMALRAAMTGHLVLTTLHSPNTTLAFDRLIDLGLDRKLLLSHINGILSQRLVRRICGACNAHGCHACEHTGFHGRFAIVESFDIKKAAPSPSFKEAAQEAIQAGLTTITECERHVEI